MLLYLQLHLKKSIEIKNVTDAFLIVSLGWFFLESLRITKGKKGSKQTNSSLFRKQIIRSKLTLNSQNHRHRMVKVSRDLWKSSGPTPWLQLAQEHALWRSPRKQTAQTSWCLCSHMLFYKKKELLPAISPQLVLDWDPYCPKTSVFYMTVYIYALAFTYYKERSLPLVLSSPFTYNSTFVLDHKYANTTDNYNFFPSVFHLHFLTFSVFMKMKTFSLFIYSQTFSFFLRVYHITVCFEWIEIYIIISVIMETRKIYLKKKKRGNYNKSFINRCVQCRSL